MSHQLGFFRQVYFMNFYFFSKLVSISISILLQTFLITVSLYFKFLSRTFSFLVYFSLMSKIFTIYSPFRFFTHTILTTVHFGTIRVTCTFLDIYGNKISECVYTSFSLYTICNFFGLILHFNYEIFYPTYEKNSGLYS